MDSSRANSKTPSTAFPYTPAILLFLGIHFLLGLIYSVITPAWEAHDEWAHYKYAEYIATQHALPPAGQPLTTLFGFDQATQPPLYYILAAIPIALVDVSDGLQPVPNPYATTGTGEGGVNMVIHDFAAESFPYRGTLLALHLARVVSVFISLFGVWFVFLLARWLLPERPAMVLAATAIAAFSPQYLFIGSVVTNDILIAVLGCATLYFSCRVAFSELRPGDFVGLAISLGLALMTKYTALGFIPVVFVALMIAGVREALYRTTYRVLVWGGVASIAILALVGWLFYRNIMIYGVPIPRDIGTWVQLADNMKHPLGPLIGIPWHLTPAALWYGFQTFWASFGWGNVGLSSWVYHLLAALFGMALLGCVILLLRRQTSRRLKGVMLFLSFSVLALAFLPLYRELLQGQPILRGRFLLPALPAVSVLSAVGLLWWWPPRFQWSIGAILTLGWLAFAIAVPFAVIEPAYARPAPPPSEDLPAGAEPLRVRFGDRAELYGYQIWPSVVKKGHAVGVTLYWKALSTNQENFSVGVYVLGADAQPYGQIVRYPGRGNFATSLWKPGDLLVETFWVPVLSERPVPCMGQIAVALFLDKKPPEYLPVTDAAGNPLGDTAIFGRFKLAPAESTSSPLEPALARFGDQFALISYEMPKESWPGGLMTITLRIQALRRPDTDYILFLHLLDEKGNRMTGVDGPPLRGNYPTSMWEKGEAFTEIRRIKVPPKAQAGMYGIGIGWYRLDTGERLPAYDAATHAELPHSMWASPAHIKVTHRVFQPFLAVQAE